MASVCEFSGHYTCTPRNVVVSNTSSLIATSVASQLTIYDACSLAVLQIYNCIDKISYIEFSPDSNYILCAMFNRNCIQVFSVVDPQWKCRINESVASIVKVSWSPAGSHHVLVESDFGIQLSVWSLPEMTAYLIASPKESGGKHDIFAFSCCNKIECKDYIGVYSIAPWTELNKFKSATSDLSSVMWTPNGLYIVVTDSNLTYKLMVYTPAGEVVCEYEAYTNALGIRCSAFFRPKEFKEEDDDSMSPLFAVGSYDGSIRLMSTSSWKLCFVCPLAHPSDMLGGMDDGVITTVEVLLADSNLNDTLSGDRSIMSSSMASSSFVAKRNKNRTKELGVAYVTKSLKSLPRAPSVGKSEVPKMGVNWLGWSHDGSLLAARDEGFPRCLWIWNGLEAKLCALLVQLDNITCARWKPQHSFSVLAFSCNSSRVYFWTPLCCSWADVPPTVSEEDGSSTEFNIVNMKWSKSGKQLILISKDKFCTCDVSFSSEGSEVQLNSMATDVDDC